MKTQKSLNISMDSCVDNVIPNKNHEPISFQDCNRLHCYALYNQHPRMISRNHSNTYMNEAVWCCECFHFLNIA